MKIFKIKFLCHLKEFTWINSFLVQAMDEEDATEKGQELEDALNETLECRVELHTVEER